MYHACKINSIHLTLTNSLLYHSANKKIHLPSAPEQRPAIPSPDLRHSHLERGRRHEPLLDVVHLHLVVLAAVDDDDVGGVAVVDDAVRLDARHAGGVEGPLVLPRAERHQALHGDLRRAQADADSGHRQTDRQSMAAMCRRGVKGRCGNI